MDSILIIEIDRIYRINKIFSRFPDETVKTTSALRRKVIDLVTLLEAISKKGFWFKIKAESSFTATLENEDPTPILGQKTFLR